MNGATEVLGAVLRRAAGKPVFIGLGTAAVLAAGAAQVQAATGDAPALRVTVTSVKEARAGTRVRIPAGVEALNAAAEDVKVVSIKATSSGVDAKLTGECVDGCPLSDKLPAGETERVPLTRVTIPRDIEKTTTVTVRVLVDSGTTEPAADTTTITFKPVITRPPSPSPTATPSPTPTVTPTKSPGKPSPTPTRSSRGGRGDDNDGRSGSGSGGGSGSSGSGSGPGPGSSYTPPTPNGSFTTPSAAPSPRVALPPVATPSPAVAPRATPTPESRLRNNKAPVAQDLTFERMASAQVAWLAALMVALSLLGTQLRLGRRVGGTATGRPRGHHRRPRRGLFGK